MSTTNEYCPAQDMAEYTPGSTYSSVHQHAAASAEQGTIMTFRDRLVAMDACPEALAWVGARTLRQAYHECDRADWLAWLIECVAPQYAGILARGYAMSVIAQWRGRPPAVVLYYLDKGEQTLRWLARSAARSEVCVETRNAARAAAWAAWAAWAATRDAASEAAWTAVRAAGCEAHRHRELCDFTRGVVPVEELEARMRQ
jgi:hypothetical protein